jgi:hypothetical protein
MFVRQSVLPDTNIVDQAIHEFIGSRIPNLHGLASSHQSRLTLERNRLLAVGVEIKPAFFLFVVDHKGD